MSVSDAWSTLRSSGCSLTIQELMNDRSVPVYEGFDRMACRLNARQQFGCKSLKPFVTAFDPKFEEASPLVIPGVTLSMRDLESKFNVEFATHPVPKFGRYFNFQARVDSFSQTDMDTETRRRLAESGFALMGSTACFFCGLRLKSGTTEAPIDYHIRLMPACHFARAMIGRPLTEAELEKATDTEMRSGPVIDLLEAGVDGGTMRRVVRKLVVDGHPSPRHGQLLGLVCDDLESNYQATPAENEALECKVCVSNKIDVAFLPCGHLCLCLSCSKPQKTCPICREQIQARHIATL